MKCPSEFEALACRLDSAHVFSHMGTHDGQHIYWTDAGAQCDSLTRRDGTRISGKKPAEKQSAFRQVLTTKY
jgi:hypothetical protein